MIELPLNSVLSFHVFSKRALCFDGVEILIGLLFVIYLPSC